MMCSCNLNLSDPTIISGIIGVIGSLLGVILGCIINYFSNCGRKIVKFNDIIVELEEDSSNDSLANDIVYIPVISISFKLFISNNTHQNYSLSFLRLIIKEKNYNNVVLQLKEKNKYQTSGGIILHDDADNYVLSPNSSLILDLVCEQHDLKILQNHKTKLYFQYTNSKGKQIKKRIKYKF